jgi:hypothetical protein
MRFTEAQLREYHERGYLVHRGADRPAHSRGPPRAARAPGRFTVKLAERQRARAARARARLDES